MPLAVPLRFCAFALVTFVLVVTSIHLGADAYVYPLPGVVAEGELGGRVQAGGVPSGFGAQPSPNSLLSTPEYEAFGAKISTARYNHHGGTFVRTANEDCAAILNDRLIDGNHPIHGGLNALGLQHHPTGFAGMVALSIVNDDVGNGRRIYWTVSATVTLVQQALYNTINTDMNRWQASINQAGDVWVFVDPTANVAGPNTTPSELCLAHQTPLGQQAAVPINPTPRYNAANNAPQFNRNNPALTAFPLGFPQANPVGPVPWVSGTYQNYWTNTWRPAERVAALQTAETTGARFCFRSHPFEEFRYQQRSYWALNAPTPFISFSRVNNANNVLPSQNLPLCQCAGSRLAAYLRHIDVFGAPGVEIEPRKYSKGYWEPESTWNLRSTQFAQRLERIRKNNRVVCFAESRNNALLNRNQVYEVNGRNFYDIRPTAASCATCQAQIQFIYGNQVAPGCGNAHALTAAQLIGATAWGNLDPSLQSRSFVALDEQICEEQMGDPPSAKENDLRTPLLVQNNHSLLRSMRRRRTPVSRQ